MKENTYGTKEWEMSPISNNKQADEYKALVEKLMQLGLREMHSAEMKPREPITNIPATLFKISSENPKIPTKISTLKGKLHKSPICLPTFKIDKSRKSHTSSPGSNNEKIKTTTIKFELSSQFKMNHA